MNNYGSLWRKSCGQMSPSAWSQAISPTALQQHHHFISVAIVIILHHHFIIILILVIKSGDNDSLLNFIFKLVSSQFHGSMYTCDDHIRYFCLSLPLYSLCYPFLLIFNLSFQPRSELDWDLLYH